MISKNYPEKNESKESNAFLPFSATYFLTRYLQDGTHVVIVSANIIMGQMFWKVLQQYLRAMSRAVLYTYFLFCRGVSVIVMPRAIQTCDLKQLYNNVLEFFIQQKLAPFSNCIYCISESSCFVHRIHIFIFNNLFLFTLLFIIFRASIQKKHFHFLFGCY